MHIIMNKKITFTLTSCGRPDLLERTLDSFFEYNTYQIEKFIISEDAAIVGINDVLIKKYSDKNIAWKTLKPLTILVQSKILYQ